MTVGECFKFGFSRRSDVKRAVVLLVFLSILDHLTVCNSQDNYRDSRKLFGGYRITPTYCKASRAAKYNRGNTICMFNHECVQRGGEVVGACMDGFLFGACCQLKSDSQSHIPKGPGVVMTSYLDYRDPEAETATLDDYDTYELNSWHHSFKPIVTPGYRPGEKHQSQTTRKPTTPNFSTETTQAEIISEGFSQITDSLLHTPNKDSNIIYMKEKPGIYTHSTIDHNMADTILINKNGSVVDNIVRPSDFNVQVSSMQTKPTISPIKLTTTTPRTVSTHRPIFTKPVFKLKPSTKPAAKPSTENYQAVSTVTKQSSKITELSSINTIIQMLNESTPSLKDEVTTPLMEKLETKSSPSPTGTISPLSYSSGYPSSYYASTGHYVTLKPSSIGSTPLYPSSTVRYSTIKPLIHTKKPTYSYTPISLEQATKLSTVKPFISSHNPSQSTSQSIDAFDRYPTNPSNFGDSVTTFSYVSSSTTPPSKLRPSYTSTTKRPPSTSYVTGAKPSRRPVTSSSIITSGYDFAPDSFSSVTPTVIVLNSLTTKSPAIEPQFIEISQEPYKKPVSQITVNNHIESTNNIFMGKPPQQYNRPSSPTVVITPKPSPTTTPFPQRPASIITSTSPMPSLETYGEYYSPTTFKPELQTSPDDLINFPPVRNPMLNVTGSTGIYNTSVSIADDDLEIVHDVDFTTPIWQDDEKLNEKMNLFVSKIVGSLQGTFQELHDIVILDKKSNLTLNTKTTTSKPYKKTSPTKKPVVTTTKRPFRFTTTSIVPSSTKKPQKPSKKPVKATTQARRPTTTTAPPTTTFFSTKKPVTTTKKQKPIKKVTTTSGTTTVTEQNEEVTTEGYTVDTSIDYNDKNLCGVKPIIKSARIVGGKNARFGQWPWQVLVRESTWLGLFTKNKCGGVLITSRFVTTAAHCQPGFLASLVAVFGENDISADLEPRKPVSRNVKRVIVHRQYDAATFENDLALLELDTPIKFDAHIVPICMPPDETDFTGRYATVTGWGRLKYGGGVPALLQEVQVPVIDNAACQEMFQTAGHAKRILNSFLCAGYANGQKDSCEGDSGGPLVVQRDDGRWQLVGTVSHGIKCAAPYLPGVYMRTTYYKPWLKSITGVRGK